MNEPMSFARKGLAAAMTLVAFVAVALPARSQPPVVGNPAPPVIGEDGVFEQDDSDSAFVVPDQMLSEQPADAPTRRQLGGGPDDVGYRLQESDRRIDALFPAGPLTPLHRAWQRTTDNLRDAIGLDLGLNYTAIYQKADTVVGGPRDASGGDLDFFGRWHLLGCEDCWPGALVFNSETRHRYGEIAPGSLNTGTVGGTIVSFGTQDFSLVETYWEQGSFDDGLIVRLGKMDSALIHDAGRYVSSNYAFLSPAFSDTLPMPLPDAGLGVAGAVYPTESLYIAAGIHDANGSRTRSGFDTFFDESEFFTALEFGLTPNYGEPGAGAYHITFWNIDARQNAGRRSDRGIALTLEQEVGGCSDVVPFLRYAYAHRGLNGIRQNLSIGVGFENVRCQSDDLIGVAASWEEPSDPTRREQYVIETFYRVMLTPHTHLTPDVQIIVDPANAPTKDAVTVFGLRLRTLF